MNNRIWRGSQLFIAMLLSTLLAGPAGADRARAHYDRGHYYPPHGHYVQRPPRHAMAIGYRSQRYYTHGGVWYRHRGASFMVVAPPVGIVVPVLPPYYQTVWLGGYPYYYVNEVYYRWLPEERGYVVSEAPREEQLAAEARSSELFVYPMSGQDQAQQSTDRYQCHAWAVGETGFDPVKPSGGVDSATWPRAREDYQRALAACLSARGYSVK